jgi:hypothetical protein
VERPWYHRCVLKILFLVPGLLAADLKIPELPPAAPGAGLAGFAGLPAGDLRAERARLDVDGFALLPPGALLEPRDERAFLAALGRMPEKARGDVTLTGSYARAPSALKELGAEFLERTHGFLRAWMPEEASSLFDGRVGLRSYRPGEYVHAGHPHPDTAGYLRVLHTLDDPEVLTHRPTELYRIARDAGGAIAGVERVVAPRGWSVVINQSGRQFFRGFPAPIHQSPNGLAEPRAFLDAGFGRFDDEDHYGAEVEAMRREQDERLAAVKAFLAGSREPR